eukprot:2701099-Alexandrium_andersonii.AAC.1
MADEHVGTLREQQGSDPFLGLEEVRMGETELSADSDSESERGSARAGSEDEPIDPDWAKEE